MSRNVRLILIGLIVIIVLAVIFMRGDQLESLIETVKKGSPLFLILAVVFQLGKYFSQGFQFTWCFRSVGSKIDFPTGIKLVFGTFFVNTIAPSFNLAGTTLVVDDASKQGIPAGKATGAALLMQLSIDSGFVIIMLIAFGILTFTVGLQPGWLLLGLAAIALVGGLVTVMILGGTKPHLVLKLLKPIERFVDRIARKFKKGPIDPWAQSTVESFSQAAALMAKNPKITIKAFLFALLASSFEMACFSATGAAFGVHDIQALVCGYVVATLFAMISFTPQGVGVVEAAVLVAFTLFGIDQAAGMAVIMVYRGIVFWMPFLIGAILIQRTKAFKEK
ncbi:MAG: flippase-like domain-containing protein [Eggerthellaceae bacterium]|nr:flippase-like domain-containing protein [Eggerthellaceae bacterium]